MAITFGNTWWGKQWLGSLDRIDFSNRLPRGKSYANKGAVTSIKIKGNQIEAKVQGTRKAPYKVNIVVPPYYEEHTSVFLKAIKNNPLVLAKLLNRELPQELMDIAKENGIKIFPESWQDIKLNCSCPDWAVPCKHLAAVIYIIANEIDKNPFMVFKLHDFDILEHLKDFETNKKTEEKQQILNLQKAATETKDLPEFIPETGVFEIIDFSIIPDLSKQISSLYPAKTLFYNGDFQVLLSSYYKKKIKDINKNAEQLNADTSNLSDLKSSRIDISLSDNGIRDIRYQHAHEEVKDIQLNQLASALNQTSTKHIHNYSADFAALYYIFHFCRRLLTQGAVLPQLTETKENKNAIRWIPALINKEIKSVYDLLLQITPPGICSISSTDKKSAIKKYFSPEENLKTVCALFLDFFFKSPNLSGFRLGNDSAVSHNEKVASLFFCPEPQLFHAFTEKEIPNSIQLWLNRFNIARKEFAPVLAIDEFENYFECRILVENNSKPLNAPIALSEFIADRSQMHNQLELIRDLAMLAEYMPELNDVIKKSGNAIIRFDNVTVVEMLQKTLPALQLFGIRIMLPKSLQQILKPQVSMKIKNKKLKSYLSFDELLDFDWRVALGDFLLTEEEFRELSKNAGKLIRIKDNYALMSEDEIKKIIRSLSSTRDISSLKLLQSVLSEEFEGAKVEIDNDLRKEIQKILQEDHTPLPKGLKASLRPYQQRGYNWMYKNARLGFGSLLADDMGLGKTLQVITTLLKFKEEGHLNKQPALVIVPTTLLTNWEKEIQKFAPGLKTTIYHGTGRRFDPKAIQQADVLLTTYGVSRSEVANFKKIQWHTVVLDEAQNIKNSETAQSKAIKQIKGKIKIAMSGTPVENRLSEYWSIFDFSNAGYLGNLSFFTEHFAKPIELNKDRKCLDNFKKITQPFILRREKSDRSIISDLPDKIENNQYCELSPEQVSLYNETVEKSLQLVNNSDALERQGLILKLLSALKQICNHPSQYLKKRDFSPTLSGKTEMLFQLLDNMYESGEKTLIFSQYAEMGGMLSEMIYERYGKKSLFLHGGCSRKQRDEMVNDFQLYPDVDTFILSLKAGGTGLNLTAAANVIHYDLWWNPAVEAQATDRAFRIGQQKNVMVHRFITKNTLEEKIDAMMQSKKELANLTVAKGESWIGNMNDKELKELITLGNK